MNSRCLSETCLRWEEIDGKWEVYDCIEHKDYSEFKHLFEMHALPLTGPLQDEVEMALDFYDHYKGSVDTGLKLFCYESEDCFVTEADALGLHNIVPDTPSERNVELIDAILGAD